MATPYIGASFDRLTALINHDNGTNLVEGVDFTYERIDEVFGNPNYNSKAILKVPEDSDKTDATVFFNRLPIADVLDSLESPPEVEIQSFPFTIHSILDDINTALGLNLDPSEVVNWNYDQASGDNKYKLQMLDSPAWLPASELYFTGNYTAP